MKIEIDCDPSDLCVAARRLRSEAKRELDAVRHLKEGETGLADILRGNARCYQTVADAITRALDGAS